MKKNGMAKHSELKNLEKVLKKYGQDHLLAFIDKLESAQKGAFLRQLKHLDFEQMDFWRKNFVIKNKTFKMPANIRPAPYYSCQPIESEQHLKYEKIRQLGVKLISRGKVAAFVVAGGQGTRLGFDGPKGDYPIGPVKNKTFFRIFAENILAASKKYRITLPWYIMTSPLNHNQTLDIFKANDYYGLNKQKVFIFQQGTLPNFSLDGKILLADIDVIATSPDGHGGSLNALYNSGAIADMKKRGIEFISYWQIDNPLVNIFDPLFIGLHAIEGSEMSSKALIKTGPFEKLGNFCLADGKMTVIEYSDLPDKWAKKKNTDGSLVFELGSIAIHIISVSFIERFNKDGLCLPLHKAKKKIAYINKRGNRIKPAKPNGVKLESFIFDALPLCSKSIILETIRSEEFAPTKNDTGVDSVDTTRQMIIARAADWLESAGVKVPRKPDGSPDCFLEIAPSFALTKDDVKAKRDKIRRFKPGDKVYLA